MSRAGRTLLAPLLLTLGGCLANESPPAVSGGDPERGRLLLEQYDCGRCHVIPGARRSTGLTGPTLAAFSRRVYLAGELPNQPEWLVRWIRQPSALVPGTLMPDQAVPESAARDMSAYLMSLH